MSGKSGAFAARTARVAAIVILLACAVTFGVCTIHWPLVGDAAIMHYVAFLTTHGMAPYRQIRDINLPGSFLLDFCVMHTLGGGALPWRMFDFLLMALATLAMMAIARDGFAGLLAGVVLAAVHGADGIFNMAQRDFVIAVAMLVGYAALFRATRTGAARWALLFGLCAGAVTTIKPTFVLLGPLVLGSLALVSRHRGLSSRRMLVYGWIGWIVPFVAMLSYLMREHAVVAFFHVMKGVAAYHASLARHTPGFLLLHSIAPLAPLVLLWIVIEIPEMKRRIGWERLALLIAAVCGLFSYVAQGKGYPYQRYPLIAFLLLMMAMDFLAAARKAGWVRTAGWAGVAFCVLFLAPYSVWRASRYDWRYTGLVGSLDRSLSLLGGGQLSGRVQCIDTVGGCYNALYDLRIVQHTGFLYDEFLFGPPSCSAVAANRQAFWGSLTANPPHVMIVVDHLFPTGPEGFGKLNLWPEFNEYLQSHYSQYEQVTTSRPTYFWARRDVRRSYRIYLLTGERPAAGGQQSRASGGDR